MNCPNCKSRDINKISKRVFFCMNSFHEIEEKPDKLIIFEMGKNGQKNKVDFCKKYNKFNLKHGRI